MTSKLASLKGTLPGIPAVTDDRELGPTVRMLVEVVEWVTGARGSATLRTSLVDEMIDLDKRLTAVEKELATPGPAPVESGDAG